eukprot:3057210-Amphidinium_carterae.1
MAWDSGLCGNSSTTCHSPVYTRPSLNLASDVQMECVLATTVVSRQVAISCRLTCRFRDPPFDRSQTAHRRPP